MRRLLSAILILVSTASISPAQTLDLLLAVRGDDAGAQLGSSVSSGDVNGDGWPDLIAGAPGDCVKGDRAGKVCIYLGGRNMDDTVDVVLHGNEVGDCFGFSLDGGGDFNGDGYSDVLVGAYGAQGRRGRAYLFLGGACMDGSPDLVVEGETTEDCFGYSVSYAGDMNSDGFDDVGVGAPLNDVDGDKAGRAYVYLGSGSVDLSVDLVLRPEGEYDYFGASVAGAEDVNGDGFDDLVVGAPAWGNPGFGSGAYPSGRAYVYFGGSPPDNLSDVRIAEPLLWLFAGGSFSGGDLNDDGYSDLLFSRQIHYSPANLYVWFGSSVPDSSVDLILTAEAPYDRFGCAASGIDLNGDGYSDIIVAAEAFAQAGKAYVHLGGSVMDTVCDAAVFGENRFDRFGNSVAEAGDVNGDGYPDVAIGAPGNGEGGESAGKLYVYKGGGVSPSTSFASAGKRAELQVPRDYAFDPAAKAEALRRARRLAKGDPTPQSPLVEEIVSGISQSDLASYIQDLEAFQTRHTFTSRCLDAASHIYDEFRAFGLWAEYDYYGFFGDRFANVVALLPGEASSDTTYILCGHYDSISEDAPYHDAPGADDNASGTAAVLEIASVLNSYRSRHTVVFVCFSGEEEGLHGSTHYASNVAEDGLNLQAVINLDMVAYTDDAFDDLFLWTTSEWLADAFASAASRYTGLITYWLERAGGDADPFEQMGYPAMMCIEYWGTQYNPYYHTSGDVFATLNPRFLTEVTKAAAATLVQLAGLMPNAPPSPTLMVTAGDRSAALNWDSSPESVPDPHSGEIDFEGYRVYRSRTPDFQDALLLAQYDKIDSLGNDTGLRYTYGDTGLVNGFPYWYAVTSYDNGYGSGIDEAESAFGENATLVHTSAAPSTDLDRIAVVPNPYKPGERWVEMGWGDKIQFVNLPEEATVRIFTLSGDLVTALRHSSPTVGSVDWYPEEVVSGVYLYSVESPIGTRVGKFVVIK